MSWLGSIFVESARVKGSGERSASCHVMESPPMTGAAILPRFSPTAHGEVVLPVTLASETHTAAEADPAQLPHSRRLVQSVLASVGATAGDGVVDDAPLVLEKSHARFVL
jgi:hypothetical protein